MSCGMSPDRHGMTRLRPLLGSAVLEIVLVALCLFLAAVAPNFLTAENLLNVLRNVSRSAWNDTPPPPARLRSSGNCPGRPLPVSGRRRAQFPHRRKPAECPAECLQIGME